jgi:hypothetical protein
MSNLANDEIGTQKHRRAFIQFGGPKPGNQVRYAGQDSQYMVIQGVSAPESGGLDPIWVPDPERIGGYRLVARSISPADLAEMTLVMREKHGSIPRQLFKQKCAFNAYEVVGTCKSLSDFIAGWSDYVMIYSMGIVTDKDMGDRMSFDSDDVIEDSMTVQLADLYPIGGLSFGEGGATEVDLAVIDVVYGGKEQCGECGPENDGAKWIYAVTWASGGSPALNAELLYSLDGGATWTGTAITGFGVGEDPVAIEVVGNYVLVVGNGAYYYAELNSYTGVPGAFTKVSTGFVALHEPTDVYVVSPREIWFCGRGGYIYKSTNLAAGVSVVNAGQATSENLRRIHGRDDTIITVGENQAIVRSTNRGATWAIVPSLPGIATDDFQAVAVIDAYRYWVGSEQGEIYYTLTAAESWTELTFPEAGTGEVTDIVFATDEVGYFAHATTAPLGQLYTTWNGGEDWTKNAPRILNLTVLAADEYTRIAVPRNTSDIAANNIVLGGLAGDGSDGILAVGVVSKL